MKQFFSYKFSTKSFALKADLANFLRLYIYMSNDFFYDLEIANDSF